MKPIELATADFEETVGKEGMVLVDFWAPWCAPCRAFTPIFEKVAESHPDITFARVNTEEQQDLAAGIGISSIPTLMAFRDGVLVFARPGMVPAAALEELIEKIGELDMDEVRRKIAEQAEKRKQASDSAAES